MSKFRKIPATDEAYKQTKIRFADIYEDFIRFNLSIQDKEKVKSESGKPDSYARYLIRLVILYEEIIGDKLLEIKTFEAIKKIEILRDAFKDEFRIYNIREARFPNAALNSFISYVAYLNSESEEMIDNELNYDINKLDFGEDIIEETFALYERPQKKKPKIKVGSLYVYPRNRLVVYKAKMKSNWQCEFNNQHETFTSMVNKKPYLDAHHLIPMATQDYYDNTIDFTDNVVCLCPTCHSRIHHAIIPQKLEMIEVLYDKRKDLYQRHEIDINKQKLESYYGIF